MAADMRQADWRAALGDRWFDSGYVVSSQLGGSVEPRNFHRSFKARCVKAGVRGRPEYQEGHAEARRAFLIGQAVRERRVALGLSQTELATSAGMTQPALSRLEAGGVVPTIPLLERISTALDADLVVTLTPHAA